MVYLFKRKFPKPDDLVMARITEIEKNGVNVVLPEYNDISGFITFSEVSRKKKRDIDKIVFVGNEMVMLVIKTDEERGYIDLSKRDVKDTEVTDYMNKLRVHKDLYNLFKYILLKLKGINDIKLINEEELYPFLVQTLFEIQEESELDNQEIYTKLLNKDSNIEILDCIDYSNLYYNREDIKEVIDNYINTKVNIKKDSKKIEFEMYSTSLNGITDIKYTLDFNNFDFFPTLLKKFDIKVTYLSAPNYLITIDQKEYNSGDINDCFNLLAQEIISRANQKQIWYKFKI